MASQSALRRLLSTTATSSATRTAELLTYNKSERKDFSSEIYNTLPALKDAQTAFHEQCGGTVMQKHLVPLFERYGVQTVLAPCLIYKRFPIGQDERVVMEESSELTKWKVRDFLGHRERTALRSLYLCDGHYTIIEYRALSNDQVSKGIDELGEYSELFIKVQHLLKLYNLERLVGHRLTEDKKDTAVVEGDAAIITT